ncbi:Bug family tripartite tricarboxylate transporter substrate binding protein [Achromobacter denitrificans]|uniref:Bug family tripartite tricarboxylate transporter substrate binding protein n=1 Tax=Achromobacter denitrificans TaxID=32002 RepID=UPI003D047E9D
MKQSAIRLIMAACIATAPLVAHAAQDNYPQKPITLQLGFPPGQATDTVARMLAERAAARLGQPVIVENKPGQGGSVLLSSFVRQPPDGYTLTIAATGAAVTNHFLYKTVNYKTPDDFTPVGLVADLPLVLVARPGMPFNDVAGLVAYAKQHPGKLNYASPGTGTSSNLAMETLKHQNGLRIEHIPYQGSARAMTDLLAGQVDIAFDTVPAVQAFVSAGKLKGLAIGSEQRLKLFPEVPTMKESGFGSVPAHVWIGFLLPKGASPAVVQKLNGVFNAVLRDQDIVEKLEGLGVVAHTTTPEGFETMLRQELPRWGDIVKQAGLEPQ